MKIKSFQSTVFRNNASILVIFSRSSCYRTHLNLYPQNLSHLELLMFYSRARNSFYASSFDSGSSWNGYICLLVLFVQYCAFVMHAKLRTSQHGSVLSKRFNRHTDIMYENISCPTRNRNRNKKTIRFRKSDETNKESRFTTSVFWNRLDMCLQLCIVQTSQFKNQCNDDKLQIYHKNSRTNMVNRNKSMFIIVSNVLVERCSAVFFHLFQHFDLSITFDLEFHRRLSVHWRISTA